MSLSSRTGTYRYFQRVCVRSESREDAGYFSSCSAYIGNGRLTVLLRHRWNPRVRRPFPLIMLDPPTIEIEGPQNYAGFVRTHLRSHGSVVQV